LTNFSHELAIEDVIKYFKSEKNLDKKHNLFCQGL